MGLNEDPQLFVCPDASKWDNPALLFSVSEISSTENKYYYIIIIIIIIVVVVVVVQICCFLTGALCSFWRRNSNSEFYCLHY